MDNLTHSLVGWAIGQAGAKRMTRKGLAALILGANMPDIDVFFGWAPWAPLATHRGFTHGLVGGVLLMPPLLAGLLWLLDRWQVSRGAVFQSGLAMHFGRLVALSYLGAVTHPLLDWQTTYSVQLLSPLSNRWYHTDTLFIIDVWIWLMLGSAIWLSRRRERRGGRWRAAASIGIALVGGYIAVNAILTALAKDAPRVGAPYAAPETIYASPGPVLFWRRELAWRESGTVAWGRYDPFERLLGLTEHTAPVPTNFADPLVRRALRDPANKAFARWSTMPFARVERGRCSARVVFGDARYARTVGADRFGGKAVVPIEAPGC
ncbi:MAG TPA: metal-dependent hydrolase [Croceibacterium sp.]|nr:metal-dependent hydrolase [Croceibacterium sp.]